MILVDLSPVIISNMHVHLKEVKEIKPILFKHFIFATLGTINMRWKKQYGEMVIAVDSSPYWRSDIFPEYKKHRTKDSNIDWKTVFEVFDDVITGIHDNFTWKIIKVKKAEADDIIATMVKEHYNNEKIMIVSPDGDFKQLQKYKGVSQYDIIRSKSLRTTSPVYDLKEKIINGDRKDSICNILSEPDSIVKKVRQKSMKKTNLEQWKKMNPNFFCNESMMKRYSENQKLIDFDYIPEEITFNIIEEYKNAPVGNRKMIYKYFIQNRFKNLITRVADFI